MNSAMISMLPSFGLHTTTYVNVVSMRVGSGNASKEVTYAVPLDEGEDGIDARSSVRIELDGIYICIAIRGLC